MGKVAGALSDQKTLCNVEITSETMIPSLCVFGTASIYMAASNLNGRSATCALQPFATIPFPYGNVVG